MATEKQILDVLILNNDPMMGLREELTHHDIGFVPGGDRRVIMGVELGDTMNRVIADTAEDFLLPDEDLKIQCGRLPKEIASLSRNLAHFGGEHYTVHLTNVSGIDAWAVYYIRLLDTSVVVA